MKSKNISKYFIFCFLDFSATTQESFLFYFLSNIHGGIFWEVEVEGHFWPLTSECRCDYGCVRKKIRLTLVLMFHFVEFFCNTQRCWGFTHCFSSCDLSFLIRFGLTWFG